MSLNERLGFSKRIGCDFLGKVDGTTVVLF